MKSGRALIIPLCIIAIGNLVDCILEKSPILDYVLYIGVLLIPIAFLWIWKKDIPKKAVSIAMLGFSIISLLFSEMTDLTGVFFFTYSIYICQNKKMTYIIYGVIFSAITIIRYSINNYQPHDVFIHLAGMLFILIIYCKCLHITKKHIATCGYLVPHVKPVVVDIVHLQIQGYDYPEINDILELNVNDDRVRRIVAEERKRQGFSNRESFVFWLTERGVFKTVSDDIKAGVKRRDKL